ncbi:hypothetical protein [Streptomyces sp. NPDC005303]|uniref:hypothetical protein n=1 Tax=Streptomyces sp. NPDC005303 TaxID=3155713 RepID=UPI0033B8DF13
MSRKPELRGRAARLARLLPGTASPGQAARTPFVLLVVLLLGGGLIGLLVLNSALSEGSFKLTDLQKDTKSLTDEQQGLQRDIDAYSAPDALVRRARELGMVPGGDPAFLDPDGTVKGVPSPASDAEPLSYRMPLVLAPEVIDGAAAQKPTAAPTSTETVVPAPEDVVPAPESVGQGPQAVPSDIPLPTTPTPGR